MIPTLIAIAVVVVLIVVFAIGSFNRFVSQKQLIKDAWSNIDTELRRRYDLIPNLVESVKGYASHEKEVFEEVTKARAMASGATGSPASQAAAEGPLVAALGRLMMVAEAYPDLKANQNFLALQTELSNTEDRLQTARRFYNTNVRDYNRRVQSFPSSMIANMKGFKTEEFFEIDEALRGDAGVPKVNFAGDGPAVSFGGAATPPPATPPAVPAPAAPADLAVPTGSVAGFARPRAGACGARPFRSRPSTPSGLPREPACSLRRGWPDEHPS